MFQFIRVFSLLILAFNTQCQGRSRVILNTQGLQEEDEFSNFITEKFKIHDFATILIHQVQPHTCSTRSLIKTTRFAFILQTIEAEEAFLENSFNDNILAIVCLTDDFEITMLRSFVNNLRHRRYTKTVFYFNTIWTMEWNKVLTELFRFSYQEKMLNALAIFKDFHTSNEFFSYAPFPQFTLEHRQISAYVNYFPQRFTNLHGHAIRTLPDQIEPRTIVLTDKWGRQTLGGYVGKFMQTLAWKLNATLKYPYAVKSGDLIFYGDLHNLTMHGVLDVPASIVPLANTRNAYNYSYPFEFACSCLMVPLANDIPLSYVFLRILSVRTCIFGILALYTFALLITLENYQSKMRNQQKATFNPVDLILNDVSLRGLLGQSFKELINPCAKLKFIYVLLFLTGLYLSCLFQAHLQTLLIQPPKEQQIRTLADTYNANLYVALAGNDTNYLNITKASGLPLVHIKSMPYSEFVRNRNQLNTEYAYSVSHIFWNLYQQQQNYFARPLFIFAAETCYLGFTFLRFPLDEHSLYREALDKLILEVRAYGLMDHWFSLNIYEMVQAGSASFKDPTRPKAYGGPLQFEDMKWIWIGYLALMCLSIAIFVGEWLYGQLKCSESKNQH